MKNIRIFFTLVILIAFAISCGDSKPEYLKEDVTGWIKVDKIPEKDDGNWVSYMNGELYTTKAFLKDLEIFLKINASTESSFFYKKSKENQKKTLDILIISKILRERFKEDPKFLKDEDKKDLMKLIKRISLIDYYRHKKIRSKIGKIKNPNIIKNYFNKNKARLAQVGIKDYRQQGIKNRYYQDKMIELEQDLLKKLIMKAKIKENRDLLDDFVKNKVNMEEAKKNPDKYWAYQIDNKKISIYEINRAMELEIKAFTGDKKLEQLIEEKNVVKTKEKLLEKAKLNELVLIKAKEEEYEKSLEGERFIELAISFRIMNYYLQKKLLPNVKDISDNDIKEYLKKNKVDDKQIAQLKKYGNMSEEKLKNAVKQKLVSEQVKKLQEEYISKILKEANVQKSKTYFMSYMEKKKLKN